MSMAKKREIPTDRHITYQLQSRTCGKANCTRCSNGKKHGPYWYAYWYEDGEPKRYGGYKQGKLRTIYIGKVRPQDAIEKK